MLLLFHMILLTIINVYITQNKQNDTRRNTNKLEF